MTGALVRTACEMCCALVPYYLFAYFFVTNFRISRFSSAALPPALSRHVAQAPTAERASAERTTGMLGLRRLSTSASALRRLRLPLTKIVATIGPASEELPTLPRVVDAGMRLMRLNFSHATEDEVELRLRNLKLSPTAAPNQLGGGCAVLLDTQGPEIRTGGLRVVREQNNRRAKVTIEKGVGVGGKQRPAWPASG